MIADYPIGKKLLHDRDVVTGTVIAGIYLPPQAAGLEY